jgi:hypothetical protein
MPKERKNKYIDGKSARHLQRTAKQRIDDERRQINQNVAATVRREQSQSSEFRIQDGGRH